MGQQKRIAMDIAEIESNFELLEDWEDRYRYLIELGQGLQPLAPGEYDPATKVKGCASQVWLVSSAEPDGGPQARLHFRGDSDAHIVKGLIAVLIALYSGRTAQDILATDAGPVFARLGLNEHLSPQRSNGFASMVSRVRQDASALAGGESLAHVN
jgi:cysteine desulfuration protein SufE